MFKVYDAQGQFLGYLVKTQAADKHNLMRHIVVYRPDIKRFLVLDTLSGELVSEAKLWFEDKKCATTPYLDWSSRYFVLKHTFGKRVVYYTAAEWPPTHVQALSLYKEGKTRCMRISRSTKLRLPAKEIDLPIKLPAATPFVFR